MSALPDFHPADGIHAAAIAAQEAADSLAESIYGELTETEAGIQQVIEQWAGENNGSLDQAAVIAGLVHSAGDEIPLNDALAMVVKKSHEVHRKQWLFRHGIDETASRMATQRAERALRKGIAA